ncbi:MAG: hypothetical protein ACYS6K_22800 [Planctomycetota bacterium]|jgi:hypothetical protein
MSDTKTGRKTYWVHMYGERCRIDGNFIDAFAEPDGVLDVWHTVFVDE